MRIKAEQLRPHLERGLAPVYLVGGDEPLLVGEACDAIRAATRAQGYDSREVMHVETGFDWRTLEASAASLSLFAERRLIELRLPTGKPGTEGGATLVGYCERPAPDTVLLVIAGKLDKDAQRAKWFGAIEQAGAVIQVWPVEAGQLPDWIARRMRARGLQPTPEAARLLAERVEGNLLAAAQEVEKLALLQGSGAVDEATVLAAVADSARFDVYGLVDMALEGASARLTRALDALRAEGVAPALVLWALAREIRELTRMAYALEQGGALDRVLATHRVWEKRRPIVTAGLRRHNVRRWGQLLQRAARVDRAIKGQGAGAPWDELLQLCLGMAGVRLFAAAPE